MRLRWAAVLLVLLAACSQRASQAEQFALEVIEENFRSTDFSARVEVTGYVIEAAADSADDLERVRYSARVLEVFAGDQLSAIEFVRYIEPGDEPGDEQEGEHSTTQIISLCRDKSGAWYLPDIGFELPDSSVLLDRARELGAEGASSRPAPASEVAAAACDVR
jgi:hypothetical protein